MQTLRLMTGLALALGSWAGVGACAGGGPPAGADAAVGAEGADDAPAGYPAGPHGVAEGEVIANLRFTDCSGSPVELGSLFGEVRVLWLALHTPLCRVCDSQNPYLREQYAAYLAQGVQLVVVLGPEDEADGPVGDARCAAYRERVGPDLPIWQDPVTAETQDLRGRGYPTQIVLDDGFTVRANDAGWDAGFDPGYYERLIAGLLP